MSNEGLPATVKRFIRDHIQSVEQMEVLALLVKAPDREWTARDVDEVLRSNEQSIAARLAQFARAGLLATSGPREETYRYKPKTTTLDAEAVETVQAYRLRRVLVIETIFKPESDSAQSFADAFRLRPQ